MEAGNGDDLKGLNVTILQDHDESGVRQARTAASLIALHAQSIRIVDLFESETLPAKHGKDVTDWIEQQRVAGLDNDSIAEELSRLCEAGVNQGAPHVTSDALFRPIPKCTSRRSSIAQTGGY